MEGLYQKRHYSIISGNPFGEHFSIEFDDWNDLYKLVTNTSSAQKRRKNTISDVHKLSIALKMRGSHEWMYKYRPQHVIFQETCMVLQQRAFFLENETGNAVPISMKCYEAGNTNHIMVHELAFGPDSDPSVRGVALWFNIPDDQVAEVAPQQAKRFRWKKTSKFDDSKQDKSSVFDTRECFSMIRPRDEDAFELVTKILEYRFAIVKAERLASIEDRFKTLKNLSPVRQTLEKMFKCQKRSWISWTYPINNGRQRNDGNTPIPPVDAEYHPIIDTKMMEKNPTHLHYEDSTEVVFGSAVERVWRSFIKSFDRKTSLLPFRESEERRHDSGTSGSSRSCGRLSIFVRLSQGKLISPNRGLPHINSFRNHKKRELSTRKTSPYQDQSERCWKSLLLKQGPEEGSNEWHVVMDHFQNFSRSKKVLTILQQ